MKRITKIGWCNSHIVKFFIAAKPIKVQSSNSLLLTVVFKYFVFMTLLSLEFNYKFPGHFWSFRLDDEVVIAMRAIFIGFFEFSNIFAENFFTFFACEYKLHGLLQFVIISNCFEVAFRAVEPSFATWSANWNLCVQNVFAHFKLIIQNTKGFYRISDYF